MNPVGTGKDPIADALTLMESAYVKAEAPPSFVSEVPDGDYQVEIQEPSLVLAKNSGALQIRWPLMILSGNLKNTIFTKYERIGSEQNCGYVKQAFNKLGITPPEHAFQIPDALIKAKGIRLNVRVKTKDDFPNTYFGSLIKAEDQAPKRNLL